MQTWPNMGFRLSRRSTSPIAETLSQYLVIGRTSSRPFLHNAPRSPPFWTPIYSNAAFQILAYALENMTGQAFPSLLTSQILKPLDMTSTFASTPASSNKSIIPINASISWYSLDTRDSAPAGGFYSSIDDLRTLGVSIINSTLLSTAQSRRWMKPVAFTADPNFAVGAP
jgi:CubicO group peptidase (beta-lactamase class C family)